MIHRTTTATLAIRSSIALALIISMALAFWQPSLVRSAETAEGKSIMDGIGMESCQKMMEQKKTMMTDMKAKDTELAEKIAKMNDAPDDKKMGEIAAVVTLMAEQRIAMDARRATMQEEMMGHMMEHMQMGKESMSQCPMMKDMKDMKGMKEKQGMSGMQGMDEHMGSTQKEQ